MTDKELDELVARIKAELSDKQIDELMARLEASSTDDEKKQAAVIKNAQRIADYIDDQVDFFNEQRVSIDKQVELLKKIYTPEQ